MKCYMRFIIKNNKIVNEVVLSIGDVEAPHTESNVYDFIVKRYTGADHSSIDGKVYYAMWDGEKVV